MIGIVARASAALMSAVLALGAGPGLAPVASAQPAPAALPADPQNAGIMCFYAAVLAGRAQTEAVAEAMWFLFDAARQATAEKPEGFVEKVEELVGATPPNLDTLATDAPALLPQCAARYPLISSKRAISLPGDEFARDTQCFALTGYMSGVAESELEDEGTSPFSIRLKALETRLDAKLPAERFIAAGLTDEAAIEGLFARALRDVSPIGNLMSVLTACEAAAG